MKSNPHFRGDMMGLFDNLTPRQRDVYKFIREKIRGRGYGPTVREIAARFDINSPNGVVCHLKALVKKGMITREPNMARAIRLAAEPIEERGLPLAGTIAAGVLHEAIEQNERVDFQEMLTPGTKNRFALQVKGDSMIEDQIADGDYVVVQKQRTARKGQIVVALTDGGEVTLKRWFPEKNRIRLEPANSSMKPIYVKNARLLGVVVGVVRKVR
ncbi:MAG: transcriptional repressor LexA [Planctomycetales bacterium]|nr:transcriptional repressor LexA [Planctomycetales bacterium]